MKVRQREASVRHQEPIRKEESSRRILEKSNSQLARANGRFIGLVAIQELGKI